MIDTSVSSSTELGFGTAGIGNLYHAISDKDAVQTLMAAAVCGLTFWDTAPFYGLGLAEMRIGKALREITPSTVRLSTKVGRRLEQTSTSDLEQYGFAEPCQNQPIFDYSASGIERSLEGSFSRIGVSKFDTVYFHDLGALTHGDKNSKHWRDALDSGLEALRSLKKEGTIRRIGIGVNETAILKEALATGEFDTFLLAGRYSLFEHRASLDFLNACEAEGVEVSIGGPFNSGLLATRPNAESRYDYQTASHSVIERATALWDVCDRFGVSAATAAIQFAGAHPAAKYVLAGGQTPEHVESIANAGKTSIPDELWTTLRQEGFVADGAPTPTIAIAA